MRPPQRRDLHALVALVRVARRARPEVDGVEALLGNSATGVHACLDEPRSRPRCAAPARAASQTATCRGGELPRSSSSPRHRPARAPRLGLSGERFARTGSSASRPARRESRSTRCRPRSRSRSALAEHETLDLHVERLQRDDVGQPLDGARDRVVARPRPAECALTPWNTSRALRLPRQPAWIESSVGSSITTRSRRARAVRKNRGSALSLAAGRVLAPKERGIRTGAPARASSIITATPPFMSVAPSPLDTSLDPPSSIRPGSCLGGHGVVVAAEHDPAGIEGTVSSSYAGGPGIKRARGRRRWPLRGSPRGCPRARACGGRGIHGIIIA